MPGSITKRGAHSWRIKYESGERGPDGRRKTSYRTVRGTRKQAEQELVQLLAAVHKGAHVDQSAITVKQLMLDWWNGHTQVTARTHEDYEETIQRYIVPQLGALRIQELKPRHIAAWHQALMKDGVRGKPLSVASIRRPHMLLNQALTEACRQELLVRNVVGMVKLPRDTRGDEVPERFLTKEEAQDVLARIYGRPVFPIAATALGTGARLGEILALRWGSVDLEAGTMTIDANITHTKAGGAAVKRPKTKAGNRTITIPAELIGVLRAWRTKVSYLRLAEGKGRPGKEDFIFGNTDGSPRSPTVVSVNWRETVLKLGLPDAPFHAWRHCHASYLIDAGLDPVEIARRLGHSSATITLRTYSHAFRTRVKDEKAALAINDLLRVAK